MNRRVRQQYDAVAPRYDVRWARYITRSTNATLDRFDASGCRVALDVGCGTGALLGRLTARAPHLELHGIDLSPAMVGVARRALPPEVGLVAGDVTALPYPAHTFDLVVSASSFHYWSDPTVALREIFGVIAPGGRLVVTDWCHDFLTCKLLDVVLRVADPAHRRTWGTADLAAALAGVGFEVQRLERYRISPLWGLMTVNALRPG